MATAQRLPVGVLLAALGLLAAPAAISAQQGPVQHPAAAPAAAAQQENPAQQPAAVPAAIAAPDSSEQQAAGTLDVEVRIAAQRLEDGRIEFGMNLRMPGENWSERVLPERRFLPPGVEPDRWYVSSSVLLQRGGAAGQPETGAGAELRIAVQPLTDGRVEFALQQSRPGGTWGERLLPARRFFPPTTAAGRWLASSPLGVTIDSGTTEPDSITDPPDTGTPPAGDPPSGGDGDQPGSVEVSDDVLDFDMVDVHTGETVNIRSVVNGETPLLFWLWSPY